ncbi:hypothetical protein ANANG_G00277070 [Anguilla anguilla]|uniref:Uncharacterized protein n=1 Tax=Anguilla anguilla TaxID=7936 RepID=A0A9D3RK70_ANGAN|nr:hypothetical protein ANANG_G00277070 [Anguilla anguilla]
MAGTHSGPWRSEIQTSMLPGTRGGASGHWGALAGRRPGSTEGQSTPSAICAFPSRLKTTQTITSEDCAFSPAPHPMPTLIFILMTIALPSNYLFIHIFC